MKLNQLCENLEFRLLQGSLDRDVTALIYDSRKAVPDCVFVCMVGAVTDGHQYIPQVCAKGAAALVVEREEAAVGLPQEVTVLQVPSARRALAMMSAAYFGYPDRKLVTIGVTGTKGKTTTTHMIRRVLELAGEKVGLIGTIGTVIGDVQEEAKNTTPESYEVHRLFARMVEAGCRYVVMEVSSQALKLDRTAGILFDYGVFTNFSPDHIGPTEHASMEEYLACKRMLFSQCRVGIVNADDPSAEAVLEGHTCQVYSLAAEDEAGTCRTEFLGRPVDLRAEEISFLKEEGKLGMRFTAKGLVNCPVKVHIPGRFSVYNALVTLLVCRLAGLPQAAILEGLSQAQVRGRVEMLPVSKDFFVVIDYAHNEVSTRSVLEALLEYHPNRLICVYGGGGNRSKLRRYDMGEVTGALADLCILTCDNPRDEEIRDINRDIQVGLARSGGKYLEIDDRKEAIAYALSHARPGDMIVLLGKGHETYQEIRGVKYPFDERQAVAEAMAALQAQRERGQENPPAGDRKM